MLRWIHRTKLSVLNTVWILVPVVIFVVYVFPETPQSGGLSAVQNKFALSECEKRFPELRKRVIVKDSTKEKCEKRFPSAILVGSQKSGTSALLQFLNYHPQIAGCINPDEPRYFNTKLYDNYSLDWYRNLMPCSTSDQITIEKTPEYLYGNTSALRIKKLNDKMKILIILKDPVTVSISVYAMWKALNLSLVDGLSFEDAITKVDANNRKVIATNKPVVYVSTYNLHIPTWLKLFSRDQILFLDGNMYEENPAQVLREVEQFLKLRKFFDESQFVFNATKNKYCFSTNLTSAGECLHASKGRKHPYVPEELKNMLYDYFKPLNLELSKMINHSFSWM
ncbi:Heparan sulfate glucosamine 3-O-sulfotransferase [Mactra antiquata]